MTTPSPAPLDDLLGYHLRRASSAVMGDLAERLGRLDLRVTEASILVVLGAHPNITQSEIGRRLAIKRANMAPLVADLLGAGLVERGTAVGRGHPLRLTAEGRARTAQVRAEMAENERALFGDLPDEMRRQLASALRRVWKGRERLVEGTRAAA
jgi:DNA-binding MarR family transcriptional regulator